MNEGTSPRMNDERRLRQPFSKGVEAVTDDEQKIADAEPKKPSARPTGWPQWSWPSHTD